MNNPPLEDHNPSRPPNGDNNGNTSHLTSNSNPDQPSNSSLPYWQINTPPPFLVNLSPKDQQTLGIPDDEYTFDSWSTVKTRVEQNKLDEFKRIPSQLRRYLEYNYRLKQTYGSVRDFVIRERLGWAEDGDGLKPRGKRPFEDEGDVKILWNDWPYGIDGRVVHLVVWCKFGLEEEDGELKGDVRGLVDEWVRGRFTRAGGRVGGLEEERVSEVVVLFGEEGRLT